MAAVSASPAAPPAPGPPEAPLGRASQDRPWRIRSVLAACVALALLSLLLPSAPTYDPWAWIIWGREILDLDLDTREGPSWKPLPVLFTTVFALFGDDAPGLWLVVARTGSLLAMALAFRLARRAAGPVAGVAAVAFLCLCSGWLRTGLLGNSEGLLLACVLWAVECHRDGRRHHALALGLAAGLLRPEVWPFLGLYGLWLWFREPRLRAPLAGAALLLPALWLGPELWGSDEALRAASRARDANPDSPAFAPRPALELFHRFEMLLIAPVEALAAVGILVAVRRWLADRRDGLVLALTGGAFAWVALVAAMTEAGYAGNTRYVILSAGLLCLVAAVGLVRVLEALRALSRRWRWLGPVVAVALVAAAVPSTAGRIDGLRVMVDDVQYEADLYRDLADAVARAGGSERVLACGRPTSGPYQIPALAWGLGVHTREIDLGVRPPAVAFLPWPPGRERQVPRAPSPPYRRLAANGNWRVMGACGPASARAPARAPARDRAAARDPA